jgi:hypothetical protein
MARKHAFQRKSTYGRQGFCSSLLAAKWPEKIHG